MARRRSGTREQVAQFARAGRDVEAPLAERFAGDDARERGPRVARPGERRAWRVPPRRINDIVLGKRSVSADTDLRLARYFGVSERLFFGLQADFDLMRKRR